MANVNFAIFLAVCVSLSALALTQAAINCRVKRQAYSKFFGNKLSTKTASTEDECAAACHLYTGSKSCRSVNYHKDLERCELMSDTLSQPDRDSFDATLFSYVYLEIVSCSGSDSKPTTPSPKPDPEPVTKPSTTSNTTSTVKQGTCGQTMVPNKVNRAALNTRSPLHRIVGGIEAKPHSMPYIVSLRTPYSNFHFCGGSLIRVNDKDESDIVVTAAHCMEETNSVKVVAGAHYLDQQAKGEQSSLGAEVVIFPSYDRPVPTNNDIAIIRLSKPIKFSDTVQPVCLPDPTEKVTDGTNLLVSGWGLTRENGLEPNALQQVVVPVVNYTKCSAMYGRGQIIPETMLCAGYDEGGKDSCQGDSGGPFVSFGNKGYTLQGVVSFGKGCARARVAGIYTRVTNYIKWIQDQVKTMSRL